MAMSKGVSRGSIVTGCLLLVLTLISIICGGVVMSISTRRAVGVSLGLWGFYFAVPGVFSILAGVKKQSNLLPVALGTNILGVILAIYGLRIGAAFWESLTHCRDPSWYSVTCSKSTMTVRHANGAVTIIFAFCAIVTLVGSIYGCIGTCCARKEPAVMATTAQPDTVVLTTQSNPAYNQQPPSYDLRQVVVDTKAQI